MKHYKRTDLWTCLWLIMAWAVLVGIAWWMCCG
jgi:hypothetical protein